MSSAKDPKTDRELLLTVVSRMDAVTESMERIAAAIEKIETSKIAGLDIRVTKLEKFMNEWYGVGRFVGIIGVVLGIIAIILRWV